MTSSFTRLESNVRGYARLFPTTFKSASGSLIQDTQGNSFIDFFCGAGSLNYGHNNLRANTAILQYIASDGVQLSLDTMTESKQRFLETFEQTILKPRKLDYKVQFTGPTGANAVEAAIKLARKQTRRSHVVAFTNAYHGHSLGSLSLTGNQYYHSEFYGSHNNVTHLPYDGYLGSLDTSALLEKMLADGSSGLPLPAAVILETVQGEGGVNVATNSWLERIESVCRAHDIRLIVDDIQTGNGRTGKFFSFEHSGIVPDIVCVSKSIGGGLPMSIVLMQSELDVWQPGEHTGTFRGNNLAFVAAAAVLQYWSDPDFEASLQLRSHTIRWRLESILARYPDQGFSVRGRGLMFGFDIVDGKRARQIIDRCFECGLMLEACGATDQVLKFMPALTIEMDLLVKGLDIFESAFDFVLKGSSANLPGFIEFPSSASFLGTTTVTSS
jgi:diaminobutyrate-2-oxoglutarate transaminase